MLETQKVMEPNGSGLHAAVGPDGPPPDGSSSAAVPRHRLPFDDKTLCVQPARRDHNRFRKRLGEPFDGPKNGADALCVLGGVLGDLIRGGMARRSHRRAFEANDVAADV